MFNKFTDRVFTLIQDKKARESIVAELECHILDKADYYEEIGYSKEVAMEKATEEMGNPDDTAIPLNALHQGSAFKSFTTIFSAILMVALFLLGSTFSGRFDYSKFSLDFPHFVSYDFLSLAIFAGYILLIRLARKKKNKRIVYAVIYSLILQILLTIITKSLYGESGFFSDITTLFQPLAYALVAICTSGFSGYVDSIFSYSYLPLSSFGIIAYRTIAVLLFAFIAVSAVLVYIEIRRQEKMKSTKALRKPLIYTLNILVAITAVNSIVMSAGTVIAYNELDEKITETQTVRQDMISCLMNAKVNLRPEKQLEYFSKSGYNAVQDTRFDLHDLPTPPYIFLYNNNMLIQSNGADYNDYYSVKVRATANERSVVEKALLCNKSDREKLSEYINGTSIEEFMKSDLYLKAFEVERILWKNPDRSSVYYDKHYFYFRFDESAGNGVEYIFFNEGCLTQNSMVDDYLQLRSNRKRMIEGITAEMQKTSVKAENGDTDIVERIVSDFAKQGFLLEENSGACLPDCRYFYANSDDENYLYFGIDTYSGYLSLYYSADSFLSGQYLGARDAYDSHMFFTYEDYDEFERGMTLDEFIEYDNGYYYENSAFVEFNAKYDRKKAEYTRKDITYSFAVEDVGRLTRFYLKFEDGKLVDKNLIGNFDEVYDSMGWLFPDAIALL